MKAFVTGVGGQLGFDVMKELINRGYEVMGVDIAPSPDSGMPYIQMDITNGPLVEQILNMVKPDVVFHCAAWTAVDLAEDADKQALVRAINVDGTANIAAVCKKLDCKLVYLSTDYVFDGRGETPWEPDCKTYAPLNVYGQSKLDGELAVSGMLEKYFIVRIAWVFGRNGNNFVKTMLNVGKNMIRCGWSMTRSVRLPIPLIWPACWWIWCRQSNTVTTMPPMKAAISAGMSLLVRSSVRQVMPRRWCR